MRTVLVVARLRLSDTPNNESSALEVLGLGALLLAMLFANAERGGMLGRDSFAGGCLVKGAVRLSNTDPWLLER